MARRILTGNTQNYHKFKLIGKEDLTHDTRLFKFELPDANSSLGILPGQHIVTRTLIDGQVEFRKYSPTSPVDQLGTFDLLIKVNYLFLVWC